MTIANTTDRPPLDIAFEDAETLIRQLASLLGLHVRVGYREPIEWRVEQYLAVTHHLAQAIQALGADARLDD